MRKFTIRYNSTSILAFVTLVALIIVIVNIKAELKRCREDLRFTTDANKLRCIPLSSYDEIILVPGKNVSARVVIYSWEREVIAVEELKAVPSAIYLVLPLYNKDGEFGFILNGNRHVVKIKGNRSSWASNPPRFLNPPESTVLLEMPNFGDAHDDLYMVMLEVSEKDNTLP